MIAFHGVKKVTISETEIGGTSNWRTLTIEHENLLSESVTTEVALYECWNSLDDSCPIEINVEPEKIREPAEAGS